MSAIKILIIDDDHQNLKVLEKLLTSCNESVIVAEVNNLLEAINLTKEKQPDLLIINYNFSDAEVFNFLDAIGSFNLSPGVIFITDIPQREISSDCSLGFDYLYKPIDVKKLYIAITKFKQLPSNYIKLCWKIYKLQKHLTQRKKLQFNSLNAIFFYYENEIIYIEAHRNYSILNLTNNRKKCISLNLGELEKTLSYPPFFRISRSAIINTVFLTEINKNHNQCTLKSGEQEFSLHIPVKKIGRLKHLL